MYKGKTFLAIIPARGGSKGIPNKNIIKINNKPLIQYTIDAALESKYLDRIIVSTDSKEIAEVSVQGGVEVPFLRPSHLAKDTSKTIDTLVFTIDKLKKQGSNYDYLVLLQPTQPLRQHFHIDEAIELIVNSDERELVSVSKVKESPILYRTIENGKLKNLLQVNSTVRRQDFPTFYKVNGAVYINKLDDNFDEKVSLNDNKMPYIMDSIFDLDIDNVSDLERFENILKNMVD